MAYYRSLSSTAVVVNNQLLASVGAVNFLKQKVKHVASYTAAAHAEIIIDDITAYIDGGKRPALKIKSAGATTDVTSAAATAIWNNKKFIKAEVLYYVNENWPSVNYNEEKCARDVDILIDALRYDLVYGGTVATTQAGKAYYSGAGVENFYLPQEQKAATLAAFEWVKFLVTELSVNRLDSPGALQEKNCSNI